MTDRRVNYDGTPVEASYVPMDETMGQRIAMLMKAKNLSQAKVARLLGVARATVNQWVLGTSKPTPENLLMLAELLGVDVHYVVFGAPRAPDGGFPTPFSEPRKRSSSPPRRRRKT